VTRDERSKGVVMVTPWNLENSNMALSGNTQKAVGQEELDDVLEVLRDGVRGYTQLGEEIGAERRLFVEKMATRRRRNLDTVVSAAAELGYEIEDHGSLGGAFRRGWTKVREALEGDESAMHEVLAEDSRTLEVIDEALGSHIPDELAEVLRGAREDIERDVEMVRASIR